jgi:multiple sugar transport system substrate-binding protein
MVIQKFGVRTVVHKALLATALLALAGGALAAETITLKVAYPSDFEPITTEIGRAYWQDVFKQFEAAHPDVKLQLVEVPGGFSDSENKIALLFRSKSTAPDIVTLSDLNLSQWASTGYLLPLNKYVASTDWWKNFNPQLKTAETIKGNIYAVSQGVNVYGLLYDKTIFTKAGIAMPWQPKNWNDILEAAKKIKASDPSKWPLWATTGTTQGTFGVFAGPGNFLAGSSVPTMQTKDGKWVVDSKGLRETVGFYRDAAANGLLAPTSKILDTNAQATPPTAMSQHQVGIVLGGSWFPDQWSKELSAPYWKDGTTQIGVTPLPTVSGQAPGAATMIGGWVLAVGSKTKYPDLAAELINLAQSKKNSIAAAGPMGTVPPVAEYTKDESYLNYAPPFRAAFAKLPAVSTIAPQDPNYSVWAQGLLMATQAVVVDPKITVDQAIQKMKDYVGNQLGKDAVVTLP